jgi:hypothetical protein
MWDIRAELESLSLPSVLLDRIENPPSLKNYRAGLQPLVFNGPETWGDAPGWV